MLIPVRQRSSLTITISDSQSGATIYHTIDGTLPSTSSTVYSKPTTITSSTTINAIATYPGTPRSNVVSATYSIILPTAPLFNPPPSTFSGPQAVTLSNNLALPMYYTTDGSAPTTSSTPYTAAIPVTKNTTINAITAAYGYISSAVSTGAYMIQAPAPAFSPASGTYYATTNAVISDSVNGATIYYTTNGTIPATSSASCSNPCSVSIATTTTLKAIASGGGYAPGSVAVAIYTISANTPTFSPASGTYYSVTLTVSISDTTTGATIYLR